MSIGSYKKTGMILLVDQVAAVTFVKYTKVSDFGKYVVAAFRHTHIYVHN